MSKPIKTEAELIAMARAELKETALAPPHHEGLRTR